jgi:glycosyltransferase involved in cell wall biosynthesis
MSTIPVSLNIELGDQIEAGKRPPRVLFAVRLDPTKKFGSIEEQITHLARVFRSKGSLFCPLFICSRPKAGDTPFQPAGIESECIDLRVFRWSRLLQLSRLITRHRIQVIHWNFTEPLRNGYLWWISIFHPRVSHLFTDHISRASEAPQSSGTAKSGLKRLLWRRYNRVFCVSQFVLNDLRRQRMHPELRLVRHFVNTDRFCPNPNGRNRLREELCVEKNFVLLTVAQLIAEKGIDVLIRTLAMLPDHVVLWIVGDGDQTDRLRKLCSELDVTARVHFLGMQRNVVPFMQAADCYVCPSLWAEAAGLANLEATACGLPVVASRTGGIPEYVEDEVTGLLFAPGDHRDLARCLQRVLREPALHRKMSIAARIQAVGRFSASLAIANYIHECSR